MQDWELAIWTTLFFVVMVLILQYISQRKSTTHITKMRMLIQQNKRLSENIETLYQQIGVLNQELGRLTAENIILRSSVRELQNRVGCIQTTIKGSCGT